MNKTFLSLQKVPLVSADLEDNNNIIVVVIVIIPYLYINFHIIGRPGQSGLPILYFPAALPTVGQRCRKKPKTEM